MSQGKIVLMACGSFSPPTPMHLRMFEIARDYIHSLGTHTVIGGVISPVHDAYGKKNLVSAQHRCAMLKLALNSSDWIKVSDWEINQEGWTRTRVSLKHHQDQLNAFLNGTANKNETPPRWLPDEILNEVLNNNFDVPDNYLPPYNALTNGNSLGSDVNSFGRISPNNQRYRNVTVKLLCGADLLESFATPNLWADEDLETILGDHGLMVVTRSGTNPERFIYESDMLYRFKRNVMLITNWVPNEVSSTVIRRLLARGESVKYLIDDAIIHYVKQNQLFGTKAVKKSAIEYKVCDTQPPVMKSPNTPEDISMTSPSSSILETGSNVPGIKNILISIRDGPSVTYTENIPVKKYRKTRLFSNINSSNTDSVAPISDIAPKVVYCDNMNPIYPGKAVKVVKNLSGQDVVVTDSDEVGNFKSNDYASTKMNVGKNEFTLGETELNMNKNELTLCDNELSLGNDLTSVKNQLILNVNELNLGTNESNLGTNESICRKNNLYYNESGIASGQNKLCSGKTDSISERNESTLGENKLTLSKGNAHSRKKHSSTGETKFTFEEKQLTSGANTKTRETSGKNLFKEKLLNLTDKMDNIKLCVDNRRDSYGTRSCNDIVKLVLTKHGIHVISDKEAIV